MFTSDISSFSSFEILNRSLEALIFYVVCLVNANKIAASTCYNLLTPKQNLRQTKRKISDCDTLSELSKVTMNEKEI